MNGDLGLPAFAQEPRVNIEPPQPKQSADPITLESESHWRSIEKYGDASGAIVRFGKLLPVWWFMVVTSGVPSV